MSDAVVGQYFDETIWRMAEVSSIGTVAGLQNPTRVILQGVTKRDQAYGNVVYLDRVNRYRRSSYSLEVEGEGKLVKRGDLVRVATELPGSWGGSFRVETYNITLRRLTLHADADWSKSGQRYITIKMRTGAPFGPVKCARVLTDNQVAINGTDLALVEAQQGTTLADALYRTDVSELPSASLSVGAPQEFLGLVHEVDAGSVEGHIRLSLTPYAASQIYAALAPLPAVPTPPTLVLPLVPGNISGIGATLLQEGTTLTLRAVWQPDRGSEAYEAQYSADAGESWQACYAGAPAQFEVAGFSGSNLLLRVRGVRGAQRSVVWSQVSVVAPAIINTLDNLGLTVEVDAAIAGALVDGLAPINAAIDGMEGAIDGMEGAIDGMAGAANDAATQVRTQVAEASDLAELQNAMDRLRAQDEARDAANTGSRALALYSQTQTQIIDRDRIVESMGLVLGARLDDNYAAFSTFTTAQATADAARGVRLSALEAAVGDESGNINAGALTSAITASVTRDQALVGAIDQLGVVYNGDLSELRDAMAAWQSNQSAQGASSLAARAMAGSETIRTSVARLDDALYSMSTVILARTDQATAAISDLATVQASDRAALANATSEVVVGYADADQQGELAAALHRWRAAQDAQAAGSAAALAIAGVRETQSGLATATDAIASLQTVVGARFGDVTADYQSLIQTQANALGALTASVVGISATSSAGTAGGRIQFVTSSSPGSGVQAAYDLQVSGSVGGVFSAAGLRVQYNVDGSTAIVMSADRFFVEAGATRQTVFVANSDGFTLSGVTQFGSTVRSTATNTDGSPKWQIKPTGELIASNATISGVIKGATLDVGEALRFGAGASLRNGQLPWPYAFFDYLHEFYVDSSLAVQRVGISPERIGLAFNVAQLGIDSTTSAPLDANRQLMAPVGIGSGSLGAWLMPDGTFRKTGSLTTLPVLGDQSQGDIHPLIWDPDFLLQSGTPKTCICWARGEDEILTVPSGVSSLALKLWGGGGSRPGNSTRTAGAGGAVQLTLAVTPGEKLRITVGLGGCFGDARTFGYWSGASAPHVDSPINGFARAGKGLFNATPLQTASGGGATMVSRINADGSETILGIAGGGGAASTSADGTPGGPYQSGVTGGAGGVNGVSCTTNGQGAGGGGAEGGALTSGGTNYIISGATSTQSVAGSASVPPLTSDTHYQAHLTRMNFLTGSDARRAPGYGAITNRPPFGPNGGGAACDITNGGSTAIGLYYGAQPGSSGLAVLIFN